MFVYVCPQQSASALLRRGIALCSVGVPTHLIQFMQQQHRQQQQFAVMNS